MPSLKQFLPLLAALPLLLPLACQDFRPGKSAPNNNASPSDESGEPDLPNRNVRFGLPAPAGTQRDAFLIERPQYVLSYNGKTRTPNWVSWELRKEDIGHAKRGPFEPDPLLPATIAKVTSHVYDNCGFDRGHMCAAQDRSATQADMDATFYTSNIVPQAPHCNQRGWERLEAYCRSLTHDGHVLWIACGPAGVGGEGKNGHKDAIGKGHIEVTVPAKVWKVVLVLPSETARPTRASRTIAVIMPNDQSVDYDWARYRVSVSEVEKLTGLNFWPTLPGPLAKDLKAKVDDVKVHVPERKGGA
jgi:endonuclease G